MSDHWMPTIRMRLTREEFDRLPRHPAFKYELIDGETWISPWPRYAHAELRLADFCPAASEVANMPLRNVNADDVPALIPLFCVALGDVQPYASLNEADTRRAAEKALLQAFTGGDGPFVEPASFVALVEDKIVGAILITLVPEDASPEDGYLWRETPPADLWETARGQPHVTWVFVRRFTQGRGIGTRLLQESVRVLLSKGYQSLWTTFMIGNDSSALWHWRNGFVLSPSMFSRRKMRGK